MRPRFENLLIENINVCIKNVELFSRASGPTLQSRQIVRSSTDY